MKKIAILAVVVLALGIVALPAVAGEHAKGAHHDLNVSFVSCDAKAKTMTFKTDAGDQKTAPINDSAMKMCPTLKAGEQVTVTCMDNDKGEHQMISHVKVAMASKEKAH